MGCSVVTSILHMKSPPNEVMPYLKEDWLFLFVYFTSTNEARFDLSLAFILTSLNAYSRTSPLKMLVFRLRRET